MDPKIAVFTAPNHSTYTFAFALDGTKEVLHTWNTRSGQIYESGDTIIPRYAAAAVMALLCNRCAVEKIY